jgi:hypothetical protein
MHDLQNNTTLSTNISIIWILLLILI